jgi:mannosyltransferase
MATRELTPAEPLTPADAKTRRQRAVALDAAAIGVALAATLALVLPWYTRRPFWFDELVSVEIAGLSPRDLLEYVVTVESNMTLYHALLSPWVAISGDVGFVRALSILFALAALPFVYALARRLFDRRTAVIAVLLTSVNVSFVGHARDARSYMLALLLVTAATYFLVRAVEDTRTRFWALYAVAAALAVWAHLLAGLVIVAHAAWLLLERRRVPQRRAVLAIGAVGLLVLPLALAIVLGGQRAQLDWVPRPGPRKLPGLFEWYVESWPTLAVYFVGGVAALLAALREWRRGTDSAPRRYPLLLLWLGLPPLAAFAISYAQPVYLYRYFIFGLPALIVLVSSGFARLRPVWLGVALAAAAVALSVRTDVTCQPDCKIRHDDFRAASAYVAAHARPGDAVVVFPSEVRTGFAHYLHPRPARLLFPARWELIGGATEGSDDLDAAMRTIGRYPRVWLLTWWLPSEPAHRALARRATRVSAREFPGNVHVELYRPR